MFLSVEVLEIVWKLNFTAMATMKATSCVTSFITQFSTALSSRRHEIGGLILVLLIAETKYLPSMHVSCMYLWYRIHNSDEQGCYKMIYAERLVCNIHVELSHWIDPNQTQLSWCYTLKPLMKYIKHYSAVAAFNAPVVPFTNMDLFESQLG